MIRKFFLFYFIIMLMIGANGVLDAATALSSGDQAAAIKLSSGGQFAKFLRWLFPALLAAAAILAMGVIVFAGFEWVTAYGNPSKIEDARDRIFNAVIGLILAFAAWLILYTINPALVTPAIFS